jgi:hypothetical protein
MVYKNYIELMLGMGQPDKGLSLPLTKYRELARNKQKKVLCSVFNAPSVFEFYKKKVLKMQEA